MQNERGKVNRDEKQDRHPGEKHTDNDKRDAKPKRPLNWDARDIKAYGWIREGS